MAEIIEYAATRPGHENEQRAHFFAMIEMAKKSNLEKKLRRLQAKDDPKRAEKIARIKKLLEGVTPAKK